MKQQTASGDLVDNLRPTRPNPADPVPKTIHGLLLLLVIGLVGYLGWVAVDGGADVDQRDVWMLDILVLLATGLLFARTVLRSADRVAWAALAIGLFCWACGDIVYGGWIMYVDPLPWPSVADYLYLLVYPCVYFALFVMVRNRLSQLHKTIWLDALVVTIGVAAYAWLAASYILSNSTSDNTAATVTTAAYPIADVILVSLLVGVLSALGWPSERMWWLLAAGFSLFLVTDAVTWILTTSGQVLPGPLQNSGWLASFTLIAYAAWSPVHGPQSISRGMRALAAPVVVVLAAFVMLIVGNWKLVPGPSTVLAIAAILVGGTRAVAVFRQVWINSAIQKQVQTDALTGLGNRRLLNLRLDDAVATLKPDQEFGLILLNINGFREVNDSYGYGVGDLLLQQVADRLRHEATAADTITRLGGDEFAVLLAPAPGRTEILAFLASVEQAMASPFVVGDIQAEFGLRAGVSICPEHAQNREDLLVFADTAMSRAKNDQLTHTVYNVDIDGTDRGQLQLTQDLRKALHSQQLVCYFQPKVDLATNKVHAVEVLVRWQHPTEGLIFPDDFLPRAERAGLMRPLTETVLDLGMAQAAEWRTIGLPITVAINLSMTNLLDLGLPDTVARTMQKYALAPESLVLEVTETGFMADPERAFAVVDRLHGLGIAISIDDYGKGYSSLSQLRDLAAQEIKLDCAFVTGVADRPDLQTIVRSTVELAHELGVTLVVEGVETQSDFDTVRKLGCDIAQGYFISRPAPASVITEWLLAREDVARETSRHDLGQ